MNDETQVIDGDEPEGYDAWFRREVEAGLKEADDPGAVWYTAEEVDEHMRHIKASRTRSLLEQAS